MLTDRRDFVRDLLVAGAIPGLAPALNLDALHRMIAEPQAAAVAGAELDPAAFDFWNGFLKFKTTPAAELPKPGSVTTRGVPGGLEREAFFFHYGSQGFRPAMETPMSELVPAGDVSVGMNVVAFRPAEADRDTFERLQSAQLRLDFIQDFPIVGLLDTMAWTAVAALQPDRTKKLPPLQNLAFDPSTSWQKMQNIQLPGGQGRWAVNLYAQKKEGIFSQLLQILAKEVGRFAPVFGFPGVTTTALQSFNAFYGAFQSRPEHLFQSNPVPVFATASALQSAGTSRSLPIRSGTYVLVPLAHADQLTADRLEGLELRQGLIVPKGTPSVALYNAAGQTLPGVTYATLDLRVRPSQPPCGR
jgi:hypothetical protein